MIKVTRWGLIGAGAALIVLSLGGLMLAGVFGWPQVGEDTASSVLTASPAIGTPQPARTLLPQAVTSTALGAAQVERRIVPPPTRTPTPTLTPTVTPTFTPSPSPSPLPVTPPEIVWTEAEKYALQWLCYGEVGGMAEAKVDACLSVISTVRMRYAYPNNFAGSDLLSTLLAPGQFQVTIYTDRPGPDPDLNWAVEQYQHGMRGSCNGFLYFNSIPGGPAQCTIRASNGQFLQFHNSW